MHSLLRGLDMKKSQFKFLPRQVPRFACLPLLSIVYESIWKNVDRNSTLLTISLWLSTLTPLTRKSSQVPHQK